MTFLGNIHSSFRRPVHLAAASLLLSFALFATRSLPAAAQRFDKTVERNAWNMTSNVCGIRADSISISQAQLYGRYTDGGFRDLSDPERLWNVGAFAQTISHFGKVSMTGKFAFDNEEAYKACGSMFSRPGAYPVDLFEFTPGRKTRQSYTIDGGIAARLSPLLTIGGKVEFLSSNYSKRKDLRYTDYLLDMKVTPSLLFSFGERVRLGLSYSYRRVAESLSAEELGISDQSYYAFLNKGLMYGSYDVWTGGASHLKEAGVSGFPVRENFHGLALQLSAGEFIAELSGSLGGGKAGEKDVRWFQFRESGLGLLLGWTHDAHRVTLKTTAKAESGSEDIIEKVTENGVTTTINYGTRNIYGSALWTLNPEYVYLGTNLYARAGAKFDWSDEVSRMVYPYSAKTGVFTAGLYASATYSIRGFDIGAGVSYLGGKWNDSLTNQNGSVPVSQAPKRLDELDVQGKWFAAAMEYATANRLRLEGSLRYNFRFGLFIGANATLTRGFHLSNLPGRHRADATFSIGYIF